MAEFVRKKAIKSEQVREDFEFMQDKFERRELATGREMYPDHTVEAWAYGIAVEFPGDYSYPSGLDEGLLGDEYTRKAINFDDRSITYIHAEESL